MLDQLGKVHDTEIAKANNVSREAVRQTRRRFGIESLNIRQVDRLSEIARALRGHLVEPGTPEEIEALFAEHDSITVELRRCFRKEPAA